MLGAIVGDADTIAAMAGSIAACRYAIPDDITTKCIDLLSSDLNLILENFISFLNQRVLN